MAVTNGVGFGGLLGSGSPSWSPTSHATALSGNISMGGVNIGTPNWSSWLNGTTQKIDPTLWLVIGLGVFVFLKTRKK